MKDGDFVHIEYTGRIKKTDTIFDTTREDEAKKSSIYSQEVKYRPVPVIIGGNFIFKGLEEEIKKMNVGESKKIELISDKAFGPRKAELTRLVSISEFRNQGKEPTVGSFVTMNGISGRVASISGGRVSIDFNHPLAGKDLVYDLEIKDAVESAEGKVKAVVSYFTGEEESAIDTSINEKTLRITIGNSRDMHSSTKSTIADIVRKWVDKFDKIEFVNVY